MIFKCGMAGKIYGPVSNHFYEEELKDNSTERMGDTKSRLNSSGGGEQIYTLGECG